jgi:hypothetical protein
MIIVNIKDIGKVGFPDDMKQDQIVYAIEHDILLNKNSLGQTVNNFKHCIKDECTTINNVITYNQTIEIPGYMHHVSNNFSNINYTEATFGAITVTVIAVLFAYAIRNYFKKYIIKTKSIQTPYQMGLTWLSWWSAFFGFVLIHEVSKQLQHYKSAMPNPALSLTLVYIVTGLVSFVSGYYYLFFIKNKIKKFTSNKLNKEFTYRLFIAILLILILLVLIYKK